MSNRVFLRAGNGREELIAPATMERNEEDIGKLPKVGNKDGSHELCEFANCCRYSHNSWRDN